jgi:Flp pilus assembly protein TadD
LKPGKQYQWSVTLVTNPKRRSKDILAGATIERFALSEATASKLTQADRSEAVRLYAEAGHWYDAVAVLSELIDANPTDATLRKQRAALLQQVGLTEIAEHDLGLKPVN